MEHEDTRSPLRMICSGGQTGVDRGALDAALELGFPCGGWCPEQRIAEDGPIPARYPLKELPGGGYVQRTRKNVEDSDATLILYFGQLSGGTELTREFCVAHGKPHLLIDALQLAVEPAIASAGRFIQQHQVAVLNIAGPRGSAQPQGQAFARQVVAGLIREIQKHR